MAFYEKKKQQLFGLSWQKSSSVTAFYRFSCVICETKRCCLKFLLFPTILFCHWQIQNKPNPPKKSKKEPIGAFYGKTNPTPLFRVPVASLAFDDALGSALEGLWVALPPAAPCRLPSERRQKYILHLLSGWTLRHLDCFLCNFKRHSPKWQHALLGSSCAAPGRWAVLGALVAPRPALPAACRAIIAGTTMSPWSQRFVSWRIWLTNVKPNFRGAAFLC